jgi:hypothetical protein
MVDRGGSGVCNDPTVMWLMGGIKTSPPSPPTVIFFRQPPDSRKTEALSPNSIAPRLLNSNLSDSLRD